MTTKAAVLGGFLVALVLSGCDSGAGTGGSGETILVSDSSWHHLGDEVQIDFFVSAPEGLSRAYPFLVQGAPSTARLSLEIRDVGEYGAGVAINGVEVAGFRKEPNGTKSVSVSTAAMRANGSNTLTIYPKTVGGNADDFEYRNLLLTVSATLN